MRKATEYPLTIRFSKKKIVDDLSVIAKRLGVSRNSLADSIIKTFTVQWRSRGMFKNMDRIDMVVLHAMAEEFVRIDQIE